MSGWKKKKKLLTSLNFGLCQQILFHYNLFRDIYAIINEALQEQLLKQLPAIQFVKGRINFLPFEVF